MSRCRRRRLLLLLAVVVATFVGGARATCTELQANRCTSKYDDCLAESEANEAPDEQELLRCVCFGQALNCYRSAGCISEEQLLTARADCLGVGCPEAHCARAASLPTSHLLS